MSRLARSGSRSPILAKSIVLGLFACGACREPPLCDPELKLNTTYVATVLEIYSQQSSAYYDSRFAQTDIATWPSCGGFDGLISGATISVKTTDTYLAASGPTTAMPAQIAHCARIRSLLNWQWASSESALELPLVAASARQTSGRLVLL